MTTIFKKISIILALLTYPLTITPKNIYDNLAMLYLPSCAIDIQEEQKQITSINEENKKINKQQLPSKWDSLKTQDLLPGEALQIAYNMLQVNDKELTDEKTNQLKHHVCKDLTLFYSGNPDKPDQHLFNKLDHTATVVGKILLQKMLYEPTIDIDVLQKRQLIIKTLLTDEALFTALNQQITTIKALEKEILWFFKKHDDTINDYYKIPYFSSENLNKNTTALGLNYQKDTTIGQTFAVITPLLLPVISSFIIQKMSAQFLSELNPDYKSPSFFKTAKTHYEARFDGMFKDKVDINMGVIGTKSIKVTKPIRAAVIALNCYELYSWYKGIKMSFAIAKSHAKVTSDIDKKMTQASMLSNAIKTLEETIQNNSQLNSIEKCTQTNTTKILNGYCTSRSPGKTLSTFNAIQSDPSSLIDLLKFAGQIDIYLSIAKYCKSLQATQYCFTEYTQDTSPRLEISELWHPMLDPNTAITNDVSLGVNDDITQNMIITGPNAGGKSTFLREVVIAVIMAQTFGIAPAQNMKVTPFALIETYLNITDTIGSQSLFQAEAARTAEILYAVKQIGEMNNAFSLVIFDEIYTGTDDETAIKEAKTDIATLSKMSHNITIMATHHHQLAHHFETHKKEFNIINNKVSVTELCNSGEEPAYTSTYKLEPGISNQKIGSSVCRDARNKYR